MRRIILTLILAGCFKPSLGDHPFMCGEAPDRCPPDYVCDGTFCVRDVADGGTKPQPDARHADARPQPDSPPGSPDARPCQGKDVDYCDGNTAVLCDGSELECAFTCDPEARLCEQCDPAQPTFCLGDTVASCSATGHIGPGNLTCLGFCTAEGGAAHCATLVPTNLPATVCDSAAAGPRNITAHIPFNTDECLGGQKVLQSSGPAICMLRYTDLGISATGSITATGSAALALVATHDLTIDGTVDVSAQGATSGSGAADPPPGQGRSDDSSPANGGGGAGYAQAGGGGGTEVADGAVPGGDGYGGPTLFTLVGGSPGGASGNGGSICASTVTPPAAGGGGGGAVQIVACHALHIGLIARVYAGGAGGAGGAYDLLCTAGGGGGGGSGGAVLVEAPAIDFGEFAAFFALGGGGGGGGTYGGSFGSRGGTGIDGNDGGMGGGGGNEYAGAGGSAAFGTAGSTVPGPGLTPQLPHFGAGGGGGAEGRVRINSRPDAPFDPSQASSFPAPTSGAIASH